MNTPASKIHPLVATAAIAVVVVSVAGAVGGGMAGNEIEKRTHKTTVYEVDVSMDNGNRQSFRYEQSPVWREGDKVRVSNGGLIAR